MAKDKDTNCLLLPRLRSRLPGDEVGCGGGAGNNSIYFLFLCMQYVCAKRVGTDHPVSLER